MDCKLGKYYEEILWALDKALQNVEGVEGEYQLVISQANFISRTPAMKAAASLRNTLENQSDIKLRLSASEGLLKIGYYQEAVLKFLTETALIEIEKIENNDEKSDLRYRVIKALGDVKLEEISSEPVGTASLDSSRCVMRNGKCVLL
jgi:HEAT repeat protein